jgi:hypothetical protein
MPLSQALRDQVERRLTQYCDERIPDHARQQVRLSYRIRGNKVTLFEQRPAFMEPDKWVDIVVAQFRFRPEDAKWLLYCADRNSRWHEYYDLEPSGNFDDLLREVDKDPTGIFWG